MPWSEKTILSKSELGRTALAQRLPVLPLRLRPVLILIDGKRTVAELGPLVSGLGGTAVLDELQALGLLEVPAAPVAAVATAVSAPPAAPLAQSEADGRLSFADYVKAVSAYFDRELGPNGQILLLQIGAAKDMRALKPLLDRGLDNLKYFKGAGALADFQAALGSRAPQA